MENRPSIFRNAFGLFVGRGLQFSVCGVAEGAQIDRRCVQGHKDGEHDVPTEKLVKYLKVLPPAFCNEIIGHAGLGGAKRLDDSNGCTHQLHERISATAHRMTEMLTAGDSIGRYDHLEEGELERELPALREAIDLWMASRKVTPMKRGGAP